MHVTHIYDGHEQIHDGRGSVPTVVWQVAREAAGAGHRVTVVERQWDGLDARARHDGVAFERFDLRTGADRPWDRVPYEMVESPTGVVRLVADRLNFARAALGRLRDLDPDVVHVHLPFAAAVLATVAPGLRDRLVYTAHLGELRLDALSDDQSGTGDPGSGAGTEDPVTATADGGAVARTDTADPDDSETAAAADGSGLAVPDVLSVVSPDVYLAKRAAATTVLNPKVADLFAERGVPRERLTVVPNGVDVDRFGDVSPGRIGAVRDQYDLDGAPVVLFVGTVMPRKGVDDLVRAAGHLADRDDVEDFHVVVAGEDDLDGAYTDEVRSLAHERGVAGRVTFAGFVPDDELAALYALADAFALPSREEGFGMTVTEAMAAGTPVVATTVGAIPRLVDEGDQGYVVEPNDPDAFADRLAALLSASDRDPASDRDHANDRDRMAACARDRASEYSWRAVGEQFRTIYEEVRA